MASRIIVALELTPSAKKSMETLTGKHGMTQVAMLSRIVGWLARQPHALQSAILAHNSYQAPAATANLVLQRMLSGKQA